MSDHHRHINHIVGLWAAGYHPALQQPAIDAAKRHVSALASLASAKEQQCTHLAQQLATIRANTDPELLASERAANAALTEEIERLQAERDAARKVSREAGRAVAGLRKECDMLRAALQAAVDCGMVPKSSASEGGANRYSEQVRVADQIRAALGLGAPAAKEREDAERLVFLEKTWFFRNSSGVWAFCFNECWDAGRHDSLREAIDHTRRIDGEAK